jgi:hypothetical protein
MLATVKVDAETKPVDVWHTSKETWEYVSIPAENAIGEVHANLSISGPNQMHIFEAGNTYLVPPIYATTLKERLKAYQSAKIRVYSPTRDMVAVNAQAKMGVGSAQAGGEQISHDPSMVSPT